MATIEYRDFDGDVEALGAMAEDSWNEEYGLNIWPDYWLIAMLCSPPFTFILKVPPRAES